MTVLQHPKAGRIAGVIGGLGIAIGCVAPRLLLPKSATPASIGQGLQLEVSAPQISKAGEPFVIRAWLRNLGGEPITLPGEGDGSVGGGGTTPLIDFRAEVFEYGSWREKPQIPTFGGCGNRDEPDEDQIHTLRPGESLPLEAEVGVGHRGRYRFRMTYENDPSHKRHDWSEGSPGVRILRKTARCEVTSDCFYLNVTRDTPEIIRIYVNDFDESDRDYDAWVDAGAAQICF